MISDKLKSWEYYYYKLPLYIRNSYGITSHFKLFYDLLVQMDKVEDSLLYIFNVFDNADKYLKAVSDGPNGYESDVLEKIGSLFGVNRVFDVKYKKDDAEVTKSLRLNNSEFLILIKSQIIKNNYKGTFEESLQYYKLIGLPIYLLNSVNPAELLLYLNETEGKFSQNIMDMFLANLFTLESMGITYQPLTTNIEALAIWDEDNALRNWDYGRWS